MTATYMADFIHDKDAVIARAFTHPAMVAKRKPTIDVALKAIVSALEFMTAEQVAEDFKPLIQDAYDMYTINNGDRDDVDAEQRDDWDSGIDDEVEKIVEPLTQVLSADWLGRNTVDTRLHEEGAIDKLVASLGKEVFRSLSYGKEPGAVLSNAGIVRTDVEAALAVHLAPKTQEETDAMSEAVEGEMEAVIEAIAAHVGKDFDHSAVSDDLEGITDDDELLASSSGSRLGLSPEHLLAVQMYVLEVGPAQCAEDMYTWLRENTEGTEPSEPKRTRKTVDKSKPPKIAATAADFDGTAFLGLLKAHSAAQDTVTATALGVSRSTYTNWSKGKGTAFAPDVAQKEYLRGLLLADLNGLAEALAMLDGTEVEHVFE